MSKVSLSFNHGNNIMKFLNIVIDLLSQAIKSQKHSKFLPASQACKFEKLPAQNKSYLPLACRLVLCTALIMPPQCINSDPFNFHHQLCHRMTPFFHDSTPSQGHPILIVFTGFLLLLNLKIPRLFQGRSQPHSPGWARVPLSSFSLKFRSIFLIFSSNFTYFLPHFGPPDGRVAHPGRPWLCHWTFPWWSKENYIHDLLVPNPAHTKGLSIVNYNITQNNTFYIVQECHFLWSIPVP